MSDYCPKCYESKGTYIYTAAGYPNNRIKRHGCGRTGPEWRRLSELTEAQYNKREASRTGGPADAEAPRQ